MEAGGGSPHHQMEPIGGTDAPTSPAAPAPVHVRERPFAAGLLLSVVTLSFYQLYWQWKVHDELCDQLGKKNDMNGVWIGYSIAWSVALSTYYLLGSIFFMRFFSALLSGNRPWVPWSFITTFLFPILMMMIAFVIAQVLFVIFVSQQYDTIKQARLRHGLPEKPGPLWFFGFYHGSMAVHMFMVVGVWFGGAPIAYYNLQQHYNEIHHCLLGDRSGTPQPRYAQAPPRGYAERDRQGQPFGTPPGTSGPPASGYGGPGAPHTYYEEGRPEPRRPTWGPPPTQDDRIGERTIRAPPDAAPQVEQTFRCPRCHGHVMARGPAGGDASIQCGRCGEGGVVRLPE